MSLIKKIFLNGLVGLGSIGLFWGVESQTIPDVLKYNGKLTRAHEFLDIESDIRNPDYNFLNKILSESVERAHGQYRINRSHHYHFKKQIVRKDSGYRMTRVPVKVQGPPRHLHRGWIDPPHFPRNLEIRRKLTGMDNSDFTDEEIEKILTEFEVVFDANNFVYCHQILLSDALRKTENKRDEAPCYACAAECVCEADCDTKTLIILGMGDALGLDFKYVSAPEHAFVRYEFKDGHHLNWESTLGMTMTDEEYIENYKIHQDAIVQGVYMRSFTDEEVIGAVFNIRGIEKILNENIDGALEDFETAKELSPLFAINYKALGIAKLRKKDFEGAIKELKHALMLDPNLEKVKKLAEFAESQLKPKE